MTQLPDNVVPVADATIQSPGVAHLKTQANVGVTHAPYVCPDGPVFHVANQNYGTVSIAPGRADED